MELILAAITAIFVGGGAGYFIAVDSYCQENPVICEERMNDRNKTALMGGVKYLRNGKFKYEKSHIMDRLDNR